MKKLYTLFLIMLLLTGTACGLAEAERELHLYLDIPYTDIPEEELAEILLEQKQVVLEHPYSTADASGIEESGYEFNFSAFYADETSIDRIVLYRAGESYAEAETFRELVQRDVMQFVTMDRQLKERYGEPDIRFFWAGDGKYSMKLSEGFTLPGGDWTVEELMTIYNSDQLIRARSVWNNVVLELWSNGVAEYPRGYLTKLELTYWNEAVEGPVTTLLEYPAPGER